MSNNIFKQIKHDLPDFPDEIIKGWLLPLGMKYGWPPREKLFGAALMFGSIDYWRNIIWEKKQKGFKDLHLSPGYQGLIDEMVSNYKAGRNSLSDSTERINNVMEYIKNEQKLPKPVVLISTDNGYDIADGNHRLVACKILTNKATRDNIILDAWIGLPRLAKTTFYWSRLSNSKHGQEKSK